MAAESHPRYWRRGQRIDSAKYDVDLLTKVGSYNYNSTAIRRCTTA